MAKNIKRSKNFIIRDLRTKGKYSIDDEYLNGYAKLCGVFGTAVYNSLCRHASRDQECFPSIDLIAEQHDIGRKSVMNGLKKLKEWRIVEIIRERDEKSKRLKNNIYILLDKSQWNQKPSASHTPGSEKKDLIAGEKSEYPSAYDGLGNQDLSPSQGLGAKSLSGTDPSPSQAESQVPHRDYKETQFKETHIRDIATDVADSSQISINCKIEGCKKEVECGKEFCKIHQPMNLTQFIAWCEGSTQKHINIIGEWAETVRPDFRTQGQWTEYIKRYSRAASSLVPFDHDQLENGFEYIKKGITEKWLKTYTLETLLKFVTGEKAN